MYNEKIYHEILDTLFNIFTNENITNIDMYNLQMKLLDYIGASETEITLKKQQINTNKSNNSMNSSERKNIKDTLTYEIELLKKWIIDLKRIGDSLAYHYFSQYDLKNLAFKQDAGFLSGKTGLIKELEHLKKIFDNGGFAILNDLTNTIRYGDISELKNGELIFHEIKTSKNKNARTKRQKKSLESVQELISNDKIEKFDGGKTYRKIAIDIREKNYIIELNEIILEAYKHGNILKQVEEGVLYQVIYGPNCKNMHMYKDILKNRNFSLYYMNQYKNSFDYMYTPLINILSNTQFYIDFLKGDLLIILYIDKDIIDKKLAEYKLSIVKMDKCYEITGLSEDGNEIKMEISSIYYDRIGRNFWSLDYFAYSISYILKEATAKEILKTTDMTKQ